MVLLTIFNLKIYALQKNVFYVQFPRQIRTDRQISKEIFSSFPPEKTMVLSYVNQLHHHDARGIYS